MKLLILSDMEGISGVTHWDHVDPESGEYGRFREIMAGDVNAAIRGARSAGVDTVVVTDGHEAGTNIQIEQLEGADAFNSGLSSPLSFVQGIQDGPDAAICIGYHARMGTQNAICDHTWSGSVNNLWLNGRICGEFGLALSICGHFHVPVLFLSGDQAVCEEAQDWSPAIQTVATKRATGRNSAECLPVSVAQERIQAGVEKAIKDFNDHKGPKVIQLGTPVTVRIEFRNAMLADQAAQFPGAKRLDGRNVEVQAEDMLTAFRLFQLLLGLVKD